MPPDTRTPPANASLQYAEDDRDDAVETSDEEGQPRAAERPLRSASSASLNPPARLSRRSHRRPREELPLAAAAPPRADDAFATGHHSAAGPGGSSPEEFYTTSKLPPQQAPPPPPPPRPGKVRSEVGAAGGDQGYPPTPTEPFHQAPSKDLYYAQRMPVSPQIRA